MKFSITYKGKTYETNHPRSHENNVRIINALIHAETHGFDDAAAKYHYPNVKVLKQAARVKLGIYSPQRANNPVTLDILKKATKLHATMKIRAIAERLGVSYNVLSVKLRNYNEPKALNTADILQKILCSKRLRI